MLIEVAVFVGVRILDKFHDIVVADHDIQILVENLLNFHNSDQSFLLPVKEGKNIHGLFLFPSPVKPLLMDEVQNLRKHELVFIVVGVGDFVFDFLAVHFGEAEVAQNAPQIFALDHASFFIVVKVEGVFDLVFLELRNWYHILGELLDDGRGLPLPLLLLFLHQL